MLLIGVSSLKVSRFFIFSVSFLYLTQRAFLCSPASVIKSFLLFFKAFFFVCLNRKEFLAICVSGFFF